MTGTPSHVEFTIPGTPQPQGSAWREIAAKAAAQAFPYSWNSGPLFTGPVGVESVAYFHDDTDGRPDHHTARPTIGELSRALYRILSQTELIADETQIAYVEHGKAYRNGLPQIDVTVTAL